MTALIPLARMGQRKALLRKSFGGHPASLLAKGLPREARSAKQGGGAEGDRTPDLDIANVALSQLSYCPTFAKARIMWGCVRGCQAEEPGLAPAGPSRYGAPRPAGEE